ncbi:MAG: hypothetical protein KC461_13110, partial [Dehalococcoidia bacterium]|nr:hypothetical protein [Dehalococcoidia bacterium]
MLRPYPEPRADRQRVPETCSQTDISRGVTPVKRRIRTVAPSPVPEATGGAMAEHTLGSEDPHYSWDNSLAPKLTIDPG